MNAIMAMGVKDPVALCDVDVIIPVLDEVTALPLLWQQLQALPCASRCHFTFVDNGSQDGSLTFLKSLDGISLIEHDSNQGYGGSLLSGFRHSNRPFLVVIDADGEYPPAVIPSLLLALDTQSVVYASRLLGKQGHREAGMPFLKWLGNRCISSLFNGLFRQQCTDLYTGCKAFRRSVMEGISFQRSGFEHVLEFSVAISNKKISITEVPIDFSPRVGGRSKMSHLVEVTKFIYWLLYFRCAVWCSGESRADA